MNFWLGATMRDVLPQYLDMTSYPVLRMSLVPYLKAQAKKAHEKGVPIVRHLA